MVIMTSSEEGKRRTLFTILNMIYTVSHTRQGLERLGQYHNSPEEGTGRHCNCCCLIPVFPHMLTKIQKLVKTREEATPRLFQPGCEASSEKEHNSLHPNLATIE